MEDSIYDEIEIEDMTFDSTLQIYHYPCPCGDRFEISLDDLKDGEDVAVCPSCSLMIRVVFEVVSSPSEKGREESGVELMEREQEALLGQEKGITEGALQIRVTA